MTNFTSTLALALVTAIPCAACAGDAETLRIWLTDKIPVAAKPIQGEAADNYQSDSVLNCEKIENDKAVSYVFHGLYRYSDGNCLVGTYITDVTPAAYDTHVSTELRGLNSRYFFELRRNSRGDHWLFKSAYMKGEPMPKSSQRMYDYLVGSRKGAFDSLNELFLRRGRTKATEITSIPGFKLLSAAEAANGRKLEVKFSYPFRVSEAIKGPCECAVVFDLDAFGLPVEFTERSDLGDAESFYSNVTSIAKAGRRKYSHTITRREEYKYQGKAIQAETTTGTVVTTLGHVPETEFTLTAFGFPEPAGVTWERPTPVYVWLLAAAGGFGALAVLFRRLARRRQPTPAAA